MKRRNADCGKLRRPIKRNKITESMYGSTTVLYMKFLVLWAIVITADFMFMFRFEFLWPFWLLLRSVHDSFKYKGLAFSVLFVCIAITSDLVCLFFIPVHWLLFAASTYVWVQYVWHTDKGICLPTVILWMLFVYLEAGIRWKDTRHMPHLDLCRPFAAHCIGYPVVTLGFGFKSYICYRLRLRKQREVGKENDFYMQLLQQALPQEEPLDETQLLAATTASGSTAQSAQNASTASSLSNATVTSNAIVTANGTLATQAQNHHSNTHQNHNNQTSDHHTHNANSSNNAGGGGSSCGSNSNNISISTILPTATSNGHVGGNTKNHRRSVDKDNRNRSSAGDNETKHNRNNNSNYQQVNADNGNNNNNSGNGGKDKTDWEGSNNYQMHQTQSQSAKDKNEDHRGVTNSSKKSNSHNTSGAMPAVNGNVMQYDADDIVVVEPVERTKGRRNRSKKDNASKDNHHQQHHNNNNNNNSSHSNNNHSGNNSNSANHLHHQQQNNSSNNKDATSHNHNSNSDASSVSSSASSSSSSSTSSVSATSTISNLASKVVSKICESCLKLEADVKKYRSELSHMKQIENELRQKLESNLTTKSCLQAKQKECEELEKRIHEMHNARHADTLQLQAAERRLTEERRQKQSLDAQLNNEKKARKLAEEKASRPECSTQCKQRKQQMDDEIKQLRRDMKLAEEAKQMAEQHGRKWEQELRMFEAEIRNRDSNQPGAEMLMTALAAMQEKNITLEKNLSAETRVKLDLFSALGDAKRQLEISESRRRSKEDEVLDLKAKIAQLLAVMPTDSLCLPSCSSAGTSSMLRMNDTPPLQTGPGPSSPMLSSLSAQQSNTQASNGGHQLNTRVVSSNAANEYVQQASTDYVGSQQKQQQHVVPVSVATSVLVSGSSSGNGTGGSNLDPNATVYTPKGGPGGMPPQTSPASWNTASVSQQNAQVAPPTSFFSKNMPDCARTGTCATESPDGSVVVVGGAGGDA